MSATFKMIGNKTYDEIIEDHRNAQIQKLTKQQRKQDKKMEQFRLATLDYKKEVHKKPVTFDDRSYGILSKVDFDIPGPTMIHTPKSTKIEVTIPISRLKSEFEMIAQQESYKPSPMHYSPQFNAFDNKIDMTIKSGKQHTSKYKRDDDKFELSPCCYKPSYSVLEQQSKKYKINKSGRRTIFDIRVPAIARYIGPGSYNPQRADRSLSNSSLH